MALWPPALAATRTRDRPTRDERSVQAPAVADLESDAGLRLAWVELDAARPAWTALAERSGSVFATWEWASLWWRHFGAGDPLIGLCSDLRDAPLGVLPLYATTRSGVRLLRFIGQGASDQLGPVSAPEAAPLATAVLAAALREREVPWDVFLAERLPREQRLEGLLPGVELTREASPIVTAPDWDSYLRSRSANFRSQLRRRERALVARHGLRYRLVTDPRRLQADLDLLFHLHEARWGRLASGALAGKRAAFHRQFAALALERGWLRLWVAEAGGRGVAVWYGFRFGGAEWYYQSGRDPAWDGSSVGFVLLAHTIREAMRDGVREYKLLRGGEPYKRRFATSDPGLVTIGLAAGARGRAALGAARAALALPPRARRPLRGLWA